VVENLLNISTNLRSYIEEEVSRHEKYFKKAKLKVVVAKEKVIVPRYYAFCIWIILLLHCVHVCMLSISKGS